MPGKFSELARLTRRTVLAHHLSAFRGDLEDNMQLARCTVVAYQQLPQPSCTFDAPVVKIGDDSRVVLRVHG
jgi:hypothetical protein